MQGLFDGDPIDDEPTIAVDGDDPLLEAEPQPQRMHGDIPIRGYNRGEPIPDLRVLARERWREVLTPLSPYTRSLAKGTVGSIPDALAANELVGDLIVSAPAPGAFGMRPGPLARLLTVRGVERALYEERRDR